MVSLSKVQHWLIILNRVLGVVFLYFLIFCSSGILLLVSVNDVDVEVFVDFSLMYLQFHGWFSVWRLRDYFIAFNWFIGSVFAFYSLSLVLILCNFFCGNLFPFCLLNMFFNWLLFIYNMQWCGTVFFLNFLWTFLSMHVAVGYWCYTLLVLSNRLVFDSSCEGCFLSCLFISVFPLHTAYHDLFWWRCNFCVSSCWFFTVYNWFLSDLFLVFFYLWMALFQNVVNL